MKEKVGEEQCKLDSEQEAERCERYREIKKDKYINNQGRSATAKPNNCAKESTGKKENSDKVCLQVPRHKPINPARPAIKLCIFKVCRQPPTFH